MTAMVASVVGRRRRDFHEAAAAARSPAASKWFFPNAERYKSTERFHWTLPE